MKSGYDLLIAKSTYSKEAFSDFEKIVGVLPTDYQTLILNYRTGYPSIDNPEESEVFASSKFQTGKFSIEHFYTPFESLNNLLRFDRIFGLRANHRKFKLLPICTSGSSYRVYYLKIDSGEIFYLDPNQDFDIDLKIDEYKLADNLKEFVLTFISEKVG